MFRGGRAINPISDRAGGEILPITTLRFLAALYVFLFHIHIRWPLAEAGTPLEQFFSLGAVGMSLFFILSGFVLAYAFKDGVIDLKAYAFSRFTRIYPVYALAALVTVPFLVVSVEAAANGGLHKLGMYAFLVATNIMLIQAWFPSTFAFWNNGGSWSISVEAFFYAIFPLAVFLLRSKSTRGLLAWAGVFYLFSVLPGIAFLSFPNPPPLPTYYAGPAFRLPEFLVGIVAGLMYAKGFRLPKPAPILILALGGLTGFLLFGNPFGHAYITLNFIAVPTIALTILSAASLERGLVFNLLSTPLLVRLGKVSYSFYAFQAFLILGLIIGHDRLVRVMPLLGDSWALAGASFAGLLVVSIAMHDLIEVRFRKYITEAWKSRSALRRNEVSAVAE